MTQLSFLDTIIDATAAKGNGGVAIVSSQNDSRKINWRAGLSDPAEMMKLARGAGEAAGIAAGLARANLAKNNGKICFASALVPGWHELGTIVSGLMTSDEALKHAGLANWDLKKIEQYVDFQDRRILTGAFAIVRGDNGDVLTYGKSVGSRYAILSNEASFDFLDAVVDGKQTRYETAGALGRGERVFVLASMPDAKTEIAEGDTVEPYILFTTSHDGSQSITCFPTSLRVCCQNTYRNAMKGRKGAGITIRHTTNMKTKVEAARRVLGLAHDAAAEFAETARTLASTPMPDPEAFFNLCLDDVVDVTIAGQKVTGRAITDRTVLDAILDIRDVEEKQQSAERLEKAKERRRELLDTILETYENERNNGLDSIRGTAWSAVNAVTEVAQHGDAVRYKGDPRARAESRFDSIMDGRAQEITQAAIQHAMTLAN
jgi:phage/plasmid-like protein (TIGR03299 family)